MLALKDDGHNPIAVTNGATALDEIERGPMLPDLILADYNLPGDMNGAQLAARIREKLHRQVPVIILSGDISTGAVREIAFQHCVQLTKPVNLLELTREIQRLLPGSPATQPLVTRHAETSATNGQPIIFVVDDDGHVRDGLRKVLEADGRRVEAYASSELFLEAYHPGNPGCLLIDAHLPGMNGIELLRRLGEAGHILPSILITGNSDVAMAVDAMKAGASDFIEKPVNASELLASIDFALVIGGFHKLTAWRETAATHVAGLTSRQRQIMDMVLAGHPSKNIAADLGISQRTVENHRASIMKRTVPSLSPRLRERRSPLPGITRMSPRYKEN